MNQPQKKDDKPKIIIDDDWKTQAQAEKEKLAHEEPAPSSAGAAPAAGGAGAAHEPAELPAASFETLVHTIASQALFALGAMPDPRDQKRYVNLDLAKFQIDSLKVLEEKTRNNLTEAEKQTLNQTMYELRTLYVQIAQRLAQP